MIDRDCPLQFVNFFLSFFVLLRIFATAGFIQSLFLGIFNATKTNVSDNISSRGEDVAKINNVYALSLLFHSLFNLLALPSLAYPKSRPKIRIRRLNYAILGVGSAPQFAAAHRLQTEPQA